MALFIRMKLKAIKSHGYRIKGAIYEATDRKAALLIKIGVAVKVEPPAAPSVEAIAVATGVDTGKPKRNQYKDREMRPAS